MRGGLAIKQAVRVETDWFQPSNEAVEYLSAVGRVEVQIGVAEEKKEEPEPAGDRYQ